LKNARKTFSSGRKGLPVVIERRPYNAETPMNALATGDITASRSFYVRNHFSIPRVDPSRWRLKVGGDVERPLRLSLPSIKRMRTKTLVATMECSGNSRSKMNPRPPGTPWGTGAVGTAFWTGVPLNNVLAKAGVKDSAVEVLFRGADSGLVGGQMTRFERSLPIDEAMDEDVILAFRMNGRPLPMSHGFPVRLNVPGWYGMASVKWLDEVSLISEPFQGRFQSSSYVYSRGDGTPSIPVTRMRVKSLITAPSEEAKVRSGSPVTISGLAWSGYGKIGRVEIRVDNSGWRDAKLAGQDLGRFCWRRWKCVWVPDKPGRYTLSSRAIDDSGHSQPEAEVFDELGYGYNTVTRINVRAV
jgi:DMSO/TMAO reductase YedYZ molybdopterin-dependent catalytic subunit